MRQRRDSQSVDLDRGKYYFPEFRDFPGYSCLRGEEGGGGSLLDQVTSCDLKSCSPGTNFFLKTSQPQPCQESRKSSESSPPLKKKKKIGEIIFDTAFDSESRRVCES